MDVHQCPRCELRFVTTSELRQHFEVDHAADPSLFDRFRYRARSSPASARTILLVGNQSLESEELLAQVADRSEGARVVVVVPATHSGHHAEPRSEPPPDDDERTDETGVALARYRLRATIERLRAAGVDATGEVGPADPYTATCRALVEHDVDEVLLSTLAPMSSRWLQADVPDRLRRHTSRPVTVLTPATAAR